MRAFRNNVKHRISVVFLKRSMEPEMGKLQRSRES